MKTNIHSDTYHIADRSLPWFAAAAAAFTVVGAGEFVTVTALVYFYGASTILLFFGFFALGLVLLAYIGQHLRRYAEEHDLQTLADVYALYHGSGIAIHVSFIGLLALIGLLVNQLVVGAHILSTITALEYWHVVLGLTVFVTAYVSYFGFRGVIVSDRVQALAIIIGSGLLAIVFLPNLSLGMSTLSNAFPPIPLADVVLFLVVGLMGAIGDAGLWQRIFATKSTKDAFWSSVGNACLWLVFGTLFVLFGLEIFAALPNADPNTAFVEFLTTLPGSIGSFLMLLVVLSIVSTYDVHAFSIPVLFSKELARWRGVKMNIKHTRLLVLGVSTVAAISALFFTDIVNVYITFLYLVSVLGAGIVLSVLGFGSRLTTTFALYLATLIVISLLVTENLFGWAPMLMFTPFVLMLLTKNKRNLV